MKNLKKISKGIILVILLLQSSFLKANVYSTTSIDELGKKIAESVQGKEFMSNTFVYGLITGYAEASLNENEKVARANNLEKFKTLNKENFNLGLQEEFARLMGFQNYQKFEKLFNMCNVSLENLKKTFPDIVTLNKSETALLFQSVAEHTKFDNLFNTSSAVSCVGNAVGFFSTCLGLSVVTQIVVFAACVAVAVAAEWWLSAGTASAVIVQALTFDAAVCKWVAGAAGTAISGECALKFVEKLQVCF